MGLAHKIKRKEIHEKKDQKKKKQKNYERKIIVIFLIFLLPKQLNIVSLIVMKKRVGKVLSFFV